MNDNFTPLSEIQKMLTFHPFKTYRLFVRFRKENKLIEEQDWIVRDKRILIDMPRFYTELEAVGYKNFKRDESISNEMHAPDSNNVIYASTSKQDVNIEREKITASEIKEVAEDSTSNGMQAPDNSEQQNERADDLHIIIKGLIKDKEHFQDQSKKLLELNQSLADQNRELTQMTHLLVAPKGGRITEEHEEGFSNELAQEAAQAVPVNES